MADLEYSSLEALARLLTKVRERIPELSQEIQEAIDLGKDTEVSDGPLRRSRKFRRKEALTDQEALTLAVDVLGAYYIELPLFIQSAAKNFRGAAVDQRSSSETSAPAKGLSERVGADKTIAIAGQTETQRTEGRSQPLKPDLQNLVAPAHEFTDEQQARLQRIKQLVSFEE